MWGRGARRKQPSPCRRSPCRTCRAHIVRPRTPSGTSPRGPVKPLTAVEYGWFCHIFGRDTELLPFDEDEGNADLRVRPDITTTDVVAFYPQDPRRG
jgi:hypothetical protein